MGKTCRWIWLVVLGCPLMVNAQVKVPASSPQAISISVYDTGLSLFRERRRMTLQKGANQVSFQQVPARLLPDTVSFTPPGRVLGIEMQQQLFEYDLRCPACLLQRYRGQSVEVHTAEGSVVGTLVSGPVRGQLPDARNPLVIQPPGERSVVMFPEWSAINEVTFSDAGLNAYLEPTLEWTVLAKQAGQQNIRLNYAAEGLSWQAFYELLLNEDGSKAQLDGRVVIENRVGGPFEDARVRIVATEQVSSKTSARYQVDVTRSPQRQEGVMRYAYGADHVTFEEWVSSLAPVFEQTLSQPVSLADGESMVLPLMQAEDLAVNRFYVYDGVRFDRFPRNRKNDWNYGTEYDDVVEAHVEFSAVTTADQPAGLAPGLYRVYQRRADSSVDLVGRDVLPTVAVGEKGHIRLGPARGLRGERERTGYREVVPLREYEESFEIRLENDSEEDVEIRVVEHLYRWPEFQIVKADTEYEKTAPQTIEFRPVLKSGGRRAIHYTVRYRW